MAVTTTTSEIERARTMLAQGENKKASRLLTDVAIACRDAEQAREIKAIAEEGRPAPACSARASGRKSSGWPRCGARSTTHVERAVPRRPNPSRVGAAAQLLATSDGISRRTGLWPHQPGGFAGWFPNRRSCDGFDSVITASVISWPLLVRRAVCEFTWPVPSPSRP